MNRRLRELLDAVGVKIDDIMMCPHHPEGTSDASSQRSSGECDCRKPRPRLLVEAAEKHNVDMERSYMLGDSRVDMAAGKEVGVSTIFIGDFKCDACSMMNGSRPGMVFATIKDFSQHLSAAKGKGRG